MTPRKILIIEPSAIGRAALSELADKLPELSLVGTAGTLEGARILAGRQRPDLILINPEFERDVLQLALREDKWNAEIILLPPLQGAGAEAHQRRNRDLQRILSRGRAPVAAPTATSSASPQNRGLDDLLPQKPLAPRRGPALIVIGSSTGGPPILEQLLLSLPPQSPPVLIAQHMPQSNLITFASRLSARSPLSFSVLESPTQLRRGMVLFAPGDKHMVLQYHGHQLAAAPLPGHRVNGHIPSVDVLFRSVAQLGAQNVISIILTGMGNDGAQGMLELRQAGALTLAQDKDSCAVFGMPRCAWELGGAQQLLPPQELQQQLLYFSRHAA